MPTYSLAVARLRRIIPAFALFLSLLLFFSGPARAVTVETAAELVQAVEEANRGGDTTIVIRDGVYDLDQGLWVEANGLTVRGESGNRDAVVLRGQGMHGGVSHIFNVAGRDFHLSDLSLGKVANHAVQIHGEADADKPVFRNVRFYDTFEQMLKVSYDDSRPEGADGGLVEGCEFLYTAKVGPQYYIGGIDAHNAKNWVVRNNAFFHIRSPESEIAEHAVHFWSNSQGTLVDANLIVNCDRGVGFGLGDRGHQGGTIINNIIYHDANPGDVGIGLESARSVTVANNTVYFENSYPHAIEYRFGSTRDCVIVNNLANRAIVSRDGGGARAQANVENARANLFVNTGGYDLHLARSADGITDSGVAVQGLDHDFDGQARPQGRGMEIGADEQLGQ